LQIYTDSRPDRCNAARRLRAPPHTQERVPTRAWLDARPRANSLVVLQQSVQPDACALQCLAARQRTEFEYGARLDDLRAGHA
jgi:hypothetical protein